MSYGFRGFIGIGAEATWGTPVAATDYFEAMSEAFETKIARFDVRNIYAGYYDPDDEAGVSTHEGPIAFAGFPRALGYALKGTMGVNSVTVVLSGFLFKNDFTFATSDVTSVAAVPAYTFEVYRDVTSSQQFGGGQFSQLMLGVSPNQDIRATAQIIAKVQANIAATAPSFPGSPTGPFTFGTCSMSIGGTGVVNCEAFAVTLDNQLDGIAALNGSTSIAKIKRKGPQLVRLKATISFEDQLDLDRFRAQSENRVVLTMTRASSFQLVIDLPRVVYSAFPTKMGGRDRLMAELEGIGRYHTGSANAAKVSLTTINTF